MAAAAGSYFSHAILTALLVLVHLNACLAARSPVPSSANGANSRFIKASCNATTYPNLCFAILSSYKLVNSSPKLLASIALKKALAAASSAPPEMRNLAKSKGLKPREAEALRDCAETLGESVSDLQKSVGEMGKIGGAGITRGQINDIQTWVSAALTNEETCLDGFSESGLNLKTINGVKPKARIQRLKRFTSIALALFDSYATNKKQ